MSLIKNRTKSSCQFYADGAEMDGLRISVNDLAGYEFKVIEGGFFTAVEYYLDLNLPYEERKRQVNEIMDTVNKHTKGSVIVEKSF